MPRVVLEPVGGAKTSLTASAPPPVSSYRSMMRSAVPFPPSSVATELATIVSGISAVSAAEASATARSKPASFWNRLTTRSTNSGRSQNVSVRTDALALHASSPVDLGGIVDGHGSPHRASSGQVASARSSCPSTRMP